MKNREFTGTSNIHEESQSNTEIEEAIDMPFLNESEALSSFNS